MLLEIGWLIVRVNWTLVSRKLQKVEDFSQNECLLFQWDALYMQNTGTAMGTKMAST